MRDINTKDIIVNIPIIKINLFRTNNFIINPNKGGSLPKDINININNIFERLSSLSI